MSEAPLNRHSRGRLTGGIILLLVGSIALADSLGVLRLEWWKHLPWLLVILGGLQFAWPGSFRERLSGYWLIVVGAYGLISIYEVFGLRWLTAWPIFVIALGLRVLLSGLFRRGG